MKKKLVIVLAAVAVLIIVAVIALGLVVRSYLSSDKLKALIIPRIEEATGRKAGISEIKVSLFSGVRVEGISLKEADGKKDFISAKEFVIKYSLLPLLKKQLVITDLQIIEPTILLVRDRSGKMNYQDILDLLAKAKKPERISKKQKTKEKTLPVSLVTNRVLIKDARVRFEDASKFLPTITAFSNMTFSFSMDKDRAVPVIDGRMELNSLSLDYGDRKITGKGSVEIKGDELKGDFTVTLDGDSINKKITVTNIFKKPHINAELYSKHLDLEKLLALVPEGSKTKDGKKTRARKTAPDRVVRAPLNLTAEGRMKVDEALYKGYKIKDFLMAFTYRNEIFTVKPLKMKLAGGDVVEAEGKASGQFSLKYSAAVSDPVSLAKKTLKGSLTAELSKGEIKRSKITEAISVFTGLGRFRNLTFSSARFLFKVRNQKVKIKGDIISDYMKANTQGVATLDGRLDLAVMLRLSPEASGGLASRITKVGLFKDENGWTELPLKITGKADNPSVGLNPAYLKRGIEKTIKQKLQKELFKNNGSKESPAGEFLKRLF